VCNGDDRTEPWPDRQAAGRAQSTGRLPRWLQDGCTEAAERPGFGIGLLATMVRAGLAVATPGVVQAGGRTLGVGDHGDGASDGRRMMTPGRGAVKVSGIVSP
jgi:hypothetical protein